MYTSEFEDWLDNHYHCYWEDMDSDKLGDILEKYSEETGKSAYCKS